MHRMWACKVKISRRMFMVIPSNNFSNQTAISVFVGKLGYADQQTIASMFQNFGVKAMRIRIQMDDATSRSKGAAFVDFGSTQEVQQACTLTGRDGFKADVCVSTQPTASQVRAEHRLIKFE
jgi:hypothetical protein